MQSGIFCITVISGTSIMLIFTQAGRRFFIVSVLWVFMAYVLMPEQSRFSVVYIVLHLHLTGKKQSYYECMVYWDRSFSVRAWDTLNLWNFKVDGTIKIGRKPMSSWNKKVWREVRLLSCVIKPYLMCTVWSWGSGHGSNVLLWITGSLVNAPCMFYYVTCSWIYEIVISLFFNSVKIWTEDR